MGYISQQGNSCGAYSIAYYLWETKKSTRVNEPEFAREIYCSIQFGHNNYGIAEDYSNPAKMAGILNYWNTDAKMYMVSDSTLKGLAEALQIETISSDVISELSGGIYAIIICSVKNDIKILHYMLVRKIGTQLQLMDSANVSNTVVWEDFSIDENKIKLTRTDTADPEYVYTGAGILLINQD